ncbi:hypothetical protein FJ546_10280 [Mesorhizobium sp. B2-4-19]|uniref:hypothetical protein n=1 Tax=Mesorhizobium sp. B2-4-19 TaxID=2589930 RepID=UPI0011284B9A|nr:hypothetical protein [Mesorhizobium sp. B2-4-19]TPK65563.1 hypothetical protein FJ546_10280 [Mesorhizobium sp. B2-4-19]
MPANDNFYIEEFLYRGRRRDDDRPTGWHVIIGVEGTDPLGRNYPPMGIMAAEAIEKGWDIPQVIAEINTEVLADLENEPAKVLDLQASLNAKEAELNAIRIAMETAVAGARPD